MPSLRNYGVFVTDAKRLLAQVKENAASLPDVTAEVAALEAALSAAEEAKVRQDSHKSDKQRATKDIQDALGRAQNAVLQLQSAAKFKLGARDPKLVGFQVAPLRSHGGRKSAKLKALEEENDLLKKQAEKKDGPATAA